MYFDELDLNDNVLDSLYDMHFDTCTPVQEKCIPEILDGKDVLGVAQTGTGKTAAYLLPILSKIDDGGYPEDAINCLVMAPTRELAQQIDQAMQGFSYYLEGVSSIAVYGGNDGTRYDQELKSMSLGADVVIATPGRFISHMNLGNVDLSKVSFFVLDEADRMLDMGFSDDILKIAKELPPSCQTIMFSATMPDKIEQLAKTLLKNPVEVKIAVSKPADKIRQSAYICHESQKMGIINDIFKNGDLKRVIIFSGSKQKVKQINNALIHKKMNSGEMHSDLDQAQRDDMMFRFKSGQTDILVATDILARGIDIDDISMVINYDVPRDAEDYVHRIGRTARADRDGRAITFVCEKDIHYFMQIEKLLGSSVEKAPLPDGLGDGPEYTTRVNRRQNSPESHDREKSGKNSRHRKNSHQTKPEDKKTGKTNGNAGDIRHNEKEKKEEKPANTAKAEKKENREKTANAKPPVSRQASDTEKPRTANKSRKRHRPKKKTSLTQTASGHSSKYAIRESSPTPQKAESGIKHLIKKPLEWIKSLKK